MRDAVLAVAVAIAGAATLLSGCLLTVGWLGILAWLFLGGHVIWTALWFVFGPGVVALAVSLFRLPFVLVGLLLAVLCGRRREYVALVARMSGE